MKPKQTNQSVPIEATVLSATLPWASVSTFCFFYHEHQRFLSNKERAYVAAWGRQGKSASPSVFYQSAPPFFKKPLVATAHVLDRRDSSHKWRWSFFRKVHSAGADRLDTECSCRWVTCIHRRRVASMLLAVSPLLPWWHVNQMSIKTQRAAFPWAAPSSVPFCLQETDNTDSLLEHNPKQ